MPSWLPNLGQQTNLFPFSAPLVAFSLDCLFSGGVVSQAFSGIFF
jgi:hypothetical protein